MHRFRNGINDANHHSVFKKLSDIESFFYGFRVHVTLSPGAIVVKKRGYKFKRMLLLPGYKGNTA
ncbi:MAG: hypothetical protein EA359_06300 [Balneolaceae bacterium]|nr:MAG: hypothetical protein EA359_06300 [Balneolaceae bacterium]